MTLMIPAITYRQIIVIKSETGKGNCEAFRMFLRRQDIKAERYLDGMLIRDDLILTLRGKIADLEEKYLPKQTKLV